MKPIALTHLLSALLLPVLLLATAANANAANAANANSLRPVVVSGTVPDEATRSAIIGKLRAVYGNERVVDQLGVGKVAAPAAWSDYVQKLLTADLKQISNGELDINGNVLSIRGDVGRDTDIEQIPARLAASLNPTYQVRNGLRVGTNEQELLDKTLGNRIVEFDSGASTLTPRGIQLLDEMLAALHKIGDRSIRIIGHTDSQGRPDANAALSQARAEAVRNYFVQHGMSASQLISIGKGASEPIASNETVDGRARNRRIEFRIAN